MVMEESEQRRERLKAMRLEAARAGVTADSESSGFPSRGLSNPLIEGETASAAPLQSTSRRFDYYTDPMSAFSGSKRTANISPQVSQGHYSTPPRPMYQNMTPSPVYQNPAFNPPGRTFQIPSGHFNQSPSGVPTEVASLLGGPHGNPPSPWGGSGGAFSHNTCPNYSRGSKFAGPGFGRGNSPYVNHGRGRGQRFNSSPHYDSGRGRMSQGSGPSSRRGSGSRDSVSAELRPDLYYRKEMVEDPWKRLNPVIWKGVRDQDKQSWLPKSITTKKSKVSTEASPVLIPRQSLAEYLAASFNDSTNEEKAPEE